MDMSGYCSDACAGVVTMEQIDELHKTCDAKAKKDFVKNGGSADEYDGAMMMGAGDSGAKAVENCFDTAFENQGLSWDGTCDGSSTCFDGWKNDGGKCTGPCSGAATMAQIDQIHMGCDEKGRKEFIKSGGDSEQWGNSLMEGAATKGVDMMASCFDTAFATAGYSWEGTCKGTTKLCFEGGWEMECSTPQCTCACENVVTHEQIQAIDNSCDLASEKEFIKNGGNGDEWEMMKMEGAGMAGIQSMETCFDKNFLEQNLAWEGICGSEVCYEGGYTMMGMCAAGTTCVGVATYAEIDAIHGLCRFTSVNCSPVPMYPPVLLFSLFLPPPIDLNIRWY